MCYCKPYGENSRILKPILFYLLIILFDGSGDINFSYCFALTRLLVYMGFSTGALGM